MQKLKLYGFNNLTKTLSFNIYDICYANTVKDRQSYIEYIDEYYNSERLTRILRNVAQDIGAHVLNIAEQDYDPQGASVTMLIAEEELPHKKSVVGHLDKSHLTVHTYPESHPQNGVCTFRVDIDVSTCGEISPLKTLDMLIGSFDSDIITMDYRVRGFTRTEDGQKIFMDHDIMSIQDFIPQKILERYTTYDVNLYEERVFHTSMMLKEYDLDNYLFNLDADDLNEKTKKRIERNLEREMKEIFYGRNFE
ncbi:MAG: adenosylmethionine decarboxylase [Christensenella sp.]|uniref:adenosylmethionine decarboxylase n=1 Tax=Christensenella sp. TaxID=1935934 RepID=UPI002B1FC30D|nr:adenosylmethionine decarboxylase [Christensenella sp.]MEA5002153.1 adenosylmethionine decarboxylase [Christensenella sp.]